MEEEYADIYYVDSRNAVVDHRRRPSPTTQWRPRPRTTATPMPPTRTVYVPPQQTVYPDPAMYANPMQPVMYPQPFPQQMGARMLFGRFTIAQVIDAVVKGFAAMKSLPTAPAPTRDTPTDVANMVLYQNALADHAKFDERIRTLGDIVAKLAG
ncbi:MAG: hypothetical protein ACKV2T_04425 [Kofleriaceae bacterium]